MESFRSIHINAMLLPLLILLMQGCATSAQKSASMRQFLQQGNPQQALIEAEQQGDDEYEDQFSLSHDKAIKSDILFERRRSDHS